MLGRIRKQWADLVLIFLFAHILMGIVTKQANANCTGAFSDEEYQFLTAIRKNPTDRGTLAVYADYLEENDRLSSAVVIRNHLLLSGPAQDRTIPKEKLIQEINAHRIQALEEWEKMASAEGLDKVGMYTGFTLEGLPSFRPNSPKALLEHSTLGQRNLIFGLELSWDKVTPRSWTAHDVSQLVRLGMSHVTKLNLATSALGNEGAALLSSLDSPFKNVTYLDLSDCELGPLGAKHLSEARSPFNKVVHLDLANNQIESAGAWYLSGKGSAFQSVTYLDLANNGLTDKGASHLSRKSSPFRAVTDLNLSFNQIGVAGIEKVTGKNSPFGNVVYLDLGGNPLGDIGIEKISSRSVPFKGVRVLKLGNTQMTAVGAKYLSGSVHENVRHLDLRFNDIEDDGVADLSAPSSVFGKVTELFILGNGIGESGYAAISGPTSVLRNAKVESGED